MFILPECWLKFHKQASCMIYPWCLNCWFGPKNSRWPADYLWMFPFQLRRALVSCDRWCRSYARWSCSPNWLSPVWSVVRGMVSTFHSKWSWVSTGHWFVACTVFFSLQCIKCNIDFEKDVMLKKDSQKGIKQVYTVLFPHKGCIL